MKSTLLLSTVALSIAAISGVAHAGERAYLDNKDIEKVVTKAESFIADAHQTGCVVVVNDSGALLFAQHLDNAPLGCMDASIAKARTSALYHTPSVNLMTRVASGATPLLSLPNAVALGGGYPLTINGVVVGAIGVSTPKQDVDNQSSEAAAAELK